MKIEISMPFTTLYPTDHDSTKSMTQLKRALTFSLKKFSNRGQATTEKICLLEEGLNDGIPAYRVRTGLLYRLQSYVPTCGMQIESIVDNRTTPVPTLEFPEVALRDYQVKAVDKIMLQDMSVLYGATGSGKTHMAAALIAKRRVPTLFITHTLDLLEQTTESFKKLLGQEIGIIGGGVFDPKPVTVAMVQSVIDMNANELPKFEQIIVDETHHLPATTFYEVTAKFPCRYVIGLSGTPYRLDKSDLMIEAGAGPIAASITASDLIEQGVLTRPVIRFIPVTGETSYRSIPSWIVYKKHIVDNEARNKMIADQARIFAQDNKSVLIYVSKIVHADNLKVLLPEAELLDGKDTSAARKKMFEDLRAGRVKILISTLGKEGVDIPDLRVVINAAGGSDTIQLVGRVLRKADGKQGAEVIDFVDNQHVTLQKTSYARLKRLQQERAFVVVVG